MFLQFNESIRIQYSCNVLNEALNSIVVRRKLRLALTSILIGYFTNSSLFISQRSNVLPVVRRISLSKNPNVA